MSLSRRPIRSVEPGLLARQQLRTALLQWREALSPKQASELTEQLGKQLITTIDSLKLRPHCIGVYWPIRGEPDLSRVYQQFIDQGLRLALPFIKPDPLSGKPLKQLYYAHWLITDALVTGRYDIKQPQQIVEVLPDLLLVPCVGFDINNYRLGYGAGFFDHTLKERPTPTIGIALAQTCVRDLHPSPSDVRLDAIQTELGVQSSSG